MNNPFEEIICNLKQYIEYNDDDDELDNYFFNFIIMNKLLINRCIESNSNMLLKILDENFNNYVYGEFYMYIKLTIIYYINEYNNQKINMLVTPF
jgi:hypothetical protein